ncbi:MAG: hypothetical protein J4432_02750 [DPANN group archaeon]|nr:hypothetical protein [DPANN group archaeon]
MATQRVIGFEIKRNVFHLVFGLFIAYLIFIFDRTELINLLSGMLIIAILVSREAKFNKRIPVVSWLLKNFERKRVWPGTGAITFITGALVSLLFFPKDAVFIAMIILAIGDSFSTIFGKIYGKHKIHGKKTLEGFLAGFFGSFIAVSFIITPIVAFITCFAAALIELFAVLDDNLLVPITVSALLFVI